MSARAPDRTTTAKNNTKSVFFMMFNFRVYERPSFYLRKIRPDTGKIDYQLRTQTDCSVGTTWDELLEPRASFAGRRPIPRSISVAELLAKSDLRKGKQLYEGAIPLHRLHLHGRSTPRRHLRREAWTNFSLDHWQAGKVLKTLAPEAMGLLMIPRPFRRVLIP